MTRALAMLLLLQLGLIAVLYWPEDTELSSRTAMVEDLARESITAVSITGEENESITLTRNDERWLLPSGLPADSSKIDTLLDALLGQDPGYAIANSPSAASRFKVGRDDYERRLALRTADASATVYLGSSPSFRKIHARADGEDGIYVLTFNSFDAAINEESWLDASLLAMGEVESINVYGNTLKLADDGWQWAEADGAIVDDAAVDNAAVESLLLALGGLRVSGVSGDSDDDIGNAEEVLRIGVANGSSAMELTVLKNDEADRYYLRERAYQQTFNTSAYDAERLVDAVAALMADPDGTQLEDSEQDAD